MEIAVNLYATFKMIAGMRTFPLTLPEGGTVQEAVAMIMELHPKLKAHWLNDKQELRGHVHVFLNRDDVNTLPARLQTVLHQGDEIDFIPPVAGG